MDNFLGFLVDFADENDFTFHAAYSGKGMYGVECLGVSGDFRSMLRKLAQAIIAKAVADSTEYVFPNFNIDELGLDTIIYFPQEQYTI